MNTIREPSLAALRDIVAEKQCAKFRFKTAEGKRKLVLIDLFTASAIVAMHDKGSDTIREIIETRSAGTLGQFLRLQSAVMGA